MTNGKVLTDKNYWETYYSENKAERDRIIHVCSAYDNYWERLINSCSKKPENIIEIGAYPGRYLAYLANKYNLKPVSLDYNSDRTRVEEAFEVMGVKNYEIIQADFLKYTPDKKYDLVLSNGFVEHFENFEEILDLHTRYLAPGGAMLIMIPNKRYLRKLYSYLVDYDNLKVHNLKTMKLSVFRHFSYRNHLETVQLGYFGGFNYSVHQKLNWIQDLIYRVTRKIFKPINGYIENNPNKFFSSTIIGIYRKKD